MTCKGGCLFLSRKFGQTSYIWEVSQKWANLACMPWHRPKASHCTTCWKPKTHLHLPLLCLLLEYHHEGHDFGCPLQQESVFVRGSARAHRLMCSLVRDILYEGISLLHEIVKTTPVNAIQTYESNHKFQ